MANSERMIGGNSIFLCIVSDNTTPGGCAYERDSDWNIIWPPSDPNVTVTQKCPGGTNVSGK